MTFPNQKEVAKASAFSAIFAFGELYWLHQLYLLRKLYWASPSFGGEYNFATNIGSNFAGKLPLFSGKPNFPLHSFRFPITANKYFLTVGLCKKSGGFLFFR